MHSRESSYVSSLLRPEFQTTYISVVNNRRCAAAVKNLLIVIAVASVLFFRQESDIDWRNIVPFQTTRAEVEAKLGEIL